MALGAHDTAAVAKTADTAVQAAAAAQAGTSDTAAQLLSLLQQHKLLIHLLILRPLLLRGGI